ncbi:hypothetical protein FE257_010382 [Aspergillus nanangensis]|uniref:chitinase n=1 Tax=Aspergillus nanangensis TaxID=2582783 RepID=A0AAD4CIM2_ASPNN|nr:hypothetical protein FE257_010382 [Aspergillus nanangensis]
MARLSMPLFVFLFLLLFHCVVSISVDDYLDDHESLQLLASGNDGYTCAKDKGCEIGCCGPLDKSGKGYCGFGPEFCGKGCTSSCDKKSECDPGWGKEWAVNPTCPLNVCCSKFGFCGTTKDFCGDKQVVSPECKGNSATAKTIGYWEGWNSKRPCGRMPARDIPLGYYTHLNFAFALIDPKTFQIAHMDQDTAAQYGELTMIKQRDPKLKVYLAIGGWAMNDPGPYRTVFSDLAASTSAQDAFFESLISFLTNFIFDGVDLDWEYPVDDDRGGKPEDFANFVTFLKRLRERLNNSGHNFRVTITLPYVDWFNVMTYDMHGLWDENVEDFKKKAFAHTNLTEINAGLELLWRNNVNPERVVMGIGFYGRSFTMQDPNCLTPGCRFKGGAKKGECTGEAGVLSAGEINRILKTNKDVSIQFDKASAVKIATWDKDQWVSWDDKETLKLKIDYANRRCLGGTMIWAVDLDDGSLIEALGQAMGKNKTTIYPDHHDILHPPDIILRPNDTWPVPLPPAHI